MPTIYEVTPITLDPEPVSSELIVHSRTPLYAGGQETKWVVNGENSAGEQVSYIERFDAPGVYKRQPIVAINWLGFRAAGIVVPPELLRTGHGTLLLTDVKANGAEVYDKGLRIVAQRTPESRERPRVEVDKVFVHLMRDKHEEIRDAIHALARLATERMILLATDDTAALMVYPDETWSTICLDLRAAAVFDSQRDHATPASFQADAALFNPILAEYVMGELDTLQKILARS